MDTLKLFLIIFSSIILLVLIAIVINNIFRGKSKDDPKGYRANYPSWYYCLDGDRVRSLSELVVDNFFHQNRVQHKYEDVILKTQEKKYKYDWYLPEVDIYIEFFGFSGKKYYKTRDEKTNFYRKHHLTMIALEPSDLDNLDEKIPLKLGKYWEKIIHERHCPNCGNSLDSRI
jgi:hypothetical protein